MCSHSRVPAPPAPGHSWHPVNDSEMRGHHYLVGELLRHVEFWSPKRTQMLSACRSEPFCSAYEDAVVHPASPVAPSSRSAPTLTKNICSSLTQNLAFWHLGPVIVRALPFSGTKALRLPPILSARLTATCSVSALSPGTSPLEVSLMPCPRNTFRSNQQTFEELRLGQHRTQRMS